MSASSSTPGSAPTPPPTAAPPRTGLSGAAKAGIAVAIVLVLVVGVLAAGLVPGVSLFGSKGGASGSSSSSAQNAADPVASSHDAGALVLEVGINSIYAISYDLGSGSSLCPLVGGLSGNLTIPATTGNYSSGNAELWLFLYVNASVPSESAVAVVGSTVYFLGTIAGALCVTSLPFGDLPAHPASSATVASNLAGSAAPFTSTHSSADAVYALVENNTTMTPTWIVVYTPCAYDPTTENTTGGLDQDTFLGEANGTTGVSLGGIVEPDVNCTTEDPFTESFDLGMSFVEEYSVSSSYYDVLSLAPTAGLTTSDFGLRVANATSVLQATATVPAGCSNGATISSCTAGTGWYAVLISATNAVLATYGNATPEWGNLAADTSNVTVTGSQELIVVSSAEYGDTYTISAVQTYLYSVSGSAEL